MIFSGHVQYLRCPACGRDYSYVTPTSVLPLLTIIVWGSFQWFGVISLSAWHRAMVVLAAILLGVLFPFGLLLLKELWSQWRAQKCPECGSELTVTGGGFYDSIVPGPAELLVYVVSVVVPYLIGRLA